MQRLIVRIQRLAALIVLLAVLLMCGCQLTDWPKAREYRKSFQAAAPAPEWWDNVSIEGVKIDTYDELLTYWQSSQRTDNQFFKAAYQAILDHPLDADIVVNAINLLPHGDRKYPHTLSMQEFAIERHFYYDRPLDNYLGKPGDAIAGIARDLARSYRTVEDYASTIELMERLLDEREKDINDQLLEWIALDYSEALYAYGQTEEAVAVLESAILLYHGDWEKKLQEKLDRYKVVSH